MKIRIRATRPTPAQQQAISPLTLRVRNRALRVLDFDCEARPLHWISGDYVSKEITAMAWKFIGEPGDVECHLLGDDDPHEMLRRFVAAFHRADMVTGHYIRGYDLPLINGALMEAAMPLLPNKRAQDTKCDLVKRAGISVSQENLGGLLKLEHPKVHMDQTKWRSANRLTLEGLKLVRERVVGDVLQHIELRERLLAAGYLTAPRMWESTVVTPSLDSI